MQYITLKHERDRRLTDAVRKKLAELRLERASDRIIRQVLNEPVERGFFVSVDHIIVMERRRREGTLPRMTASTAMMWDEIFRTFDDYLTLHPSETRTNAAIHVVSRGRASRFFISHGSAKRILKTSMS